MTRCLAFAVLAACSQEPAPPVTIIDGPSPPICQASTCNPLAQTGCNIDEKCTWILGGPCGDHVGCAVPGASARGGACSRDKFGIDSCARGDVCIDGLCRRICDHLGGEPRCDAGETCTEVDAFAFGAQHLAGACVP